MKRYRKEKNSKRKARANKTGDWGEHEQAPWLMRASPSSCPGDTRVWGCMRSRHRAVLVHPQSKAHRGSAARDLYRQMMGKSGDGRNFDIHITRMGCKGYGPGNSCSALWECSGAVQGMERCGGNARRRRLQSSRNCLGPQKKSGRQVWEDSEPESCYECSWSKDCPSCQSQMFLVWRRRGWGEEPEE